MTGSRSQLRETELMLAIRVLKADEMYEVARTVFHDEMQDCDDVNNEVVGLVEYLSCSFL